MDDRVWMISFRREKRYELFFFLSIFAVQCLTLFETNHCPFECIDDGQSKWKYSINWCWCQQPKSNRRTIIWLTIAAQRYVALLEMKANFCDNYYFVRYVIFHHARARRYSTAFCLFFIATGPCLSRTPISIGERTKKNMEIKSNTLNCVEHSLPLCWWAWYDLTTILKLTNANEQFK